MNEDLTLRLFTPDDARGMAECHYSAVHRLAAPYYPQVILNEWSPPVTDERVSKLSKLDDDTVRFVAMDGDKMAGFCEYVGVNEELRACYVHADYTGRGIGRMLLSKTEAHAIAAGVKRFYADSSINALPFYQACGYQLLEKGKHPMQCGLEMDCYKIFIDFKSVKHMVIYD